MDEIESQIETQEESQTESQEEFEDKTPSEESPSTDSTEKVHTSEPKQEESTTEEKPVEETPEETLDTTDIGTLIQETHYINQRLDTITNILLVSMIGIALVFGILACSIFSKYFRS